MASETTASSSNNRAYCRSWTTNHHFQTYIKQNSNLILKDVDISNAIEAYQSNGYIVFAKRERCGKETREPMADRKFKGEWGTGSVCSAFTLEWYFKCHVSVTFDCPISVWTQQLTSSSKNLTKLSIESCRWHDFLQSFGVTKVCKTNSRGDTKLKGSSRHDLRA